MASTEQTVDVFLQQGAIHFGDRHTHIRTVLGSCVAITMWHPRLRVGGMCHYMLPSRPAGGRKVLDGKYADEALELMAIEIQRKGTRPGDYQVKLFGGGNMFPAINLVRDRSVGLMNVEASTQLLARHGLKVSAEHLGGVGHRSVIFDIGNGHVWMHHQPPAQSPCVQCEGKHLCLPA